MDHLPWLCYLVALILIAGDVGNALVTRQANGATDASSFLRRGYHASVVAGNYVYIDGGEFSTYDNGDVKYEYSNTILSIDLSKNWTNATVTLQSTSKPSSVPSLNHPGIWYDSSADTIYTGFAGRISSLNESDLSPWPMGVWSFKPDGLGSGTWDTALATDDKVFDSITRPYTAAVAYGNGVGYALGGSVTWQTAPGITGGDTSAIVNIDGMLRFDMTTKELTNVTVKGPRFQNGHIQLAQMQYVPNFGPEGVFLVLGGVKTNPETDTFDWGIVTVFDPESGRWYDQQTSGNIPRGRKEFCSTGMASDNKTFEVFVYAGWGGDLGTQSVSFDQIYILTLPAFHWIQVDYDQTGTRHALTCHPVGGSQILTIGGVNSASTDSSASIYKGTFRDKDKYTQGLAVFDLSTLEWKDQYTANASGYTQSDMVRSYYAQNGRNPNFNSTALKTVFDTTNFTSTSPSSSNTPNNTPSSNSSSSASSSAAAQSSEALSTGAIAGIAVGAVAGALVLIGGLIFLGCARRRRAREAADADARNRQYHHALGPYVSMAELHSETIAELPPDGRRPELGGAAGQMAHEKDGATVLAELPANEIERRRKSGMIR